MEAYIASVERWQVAEFLLKKLHSLSGIFPLGFFLLEHLFINAKATRGAALYNGAVQSIANIPYLLMFEIVFVALPLAYHAAYGLLITYRGQVNLYRYNYYYNWTYCLQRLSGAIAFIFVVYHVYSFRIAPAMEGQRVTFDLVRDQVTNPYYLAFTLAGTIAVSFHFSMGIWNFLIGWGIAIGPRIQRVAAVACMTSFIVLSGLGINIIYAFLG